MANLVIPHTTPSQQDSLYSKLNAYNQGRGSYKEAGAYLVVLPRSGCPHYTLWVYSPLPGRQHIFFVCDLYPDVQQSLRTASTLCFYSVRPLYIVDYNPRRMQSKGDDLIPFGKYHGHYLHEVLRIDPAYLSWIAYKYQPRTPKQERFVHIARIYHSVHLDAERRKTRPQHQGRYLGDEGQKVDHLTLTVLSVRIEDNPYKTQVRGTTPYFYVRQVLKLRDPSGNLVSARINARTPSQASCQLPASEHPYQAGDVLHIASARIARTYTIGSNKYTRLTHIKFE